MKHPFIVAILIAFGLQSTPAHAENIQWTTSGQWKIFSDHKLLGSCFMERSWPDGKYAKIGLNRGRKTKFMLLKDKSFAILATENTVLVNVSFENSSHFRVLGERLGSPTSLLFETRKDEIFTLFSAKNNMQVYIKSVKLVDFGLKGTKRAWQHVLECHARN